MDSCGETFSPLAFGLSHTQMCQIICFSLGPGVSFTPTPTSTPEEKLGLV